MNSALQRARSTIDEALPERAHRAVDAAESELLHRYLAAWQRSDFEELVGLLREDAVLRMPPQPSVLGALPVMRFLREVASGGDLSAMRLSPTWANGRPALIAQRVGDDGSLRPHGILVMDVADGLVVGFDAFIGSRFLSGFGFPGPRTRDRSP